jgi:hypothetical protein
LLSKQIEQTSTGEKSDYDNTKNGRLREQLVMMALLGAGKWYYFEGLIGRMAQSSAA